MIVDRVTLCVTSDVDGDDVALRDEEMAVFIDGFYLFLRVCRDGAVRLAVFEVHV